MKLIDNESLDRQIGVVAEVAGYLWERGWAERNGGNISVNVTGLCADAVCELPALDGPYLLPKPVPHIAGGCFLVTGTGRRMRYVASQPLANVALIRVAADGASYEIVADEPVRPTSELPAHLSVHDYLVGAGRPRAGGGAYASHRAGGDDAQSRISGQRRAHAAVVEHDPRDARLLSQGAGHRSLHAARLAGVGRPDDRPAATTTTW